MDFVQNRYILEISLMIVLELQDKAGFEAIFSTSRAIDAIRTWRPVFNSLDSSWATSGQPSCKSPLLAAVMS